MSRADDEESVVSNAETKVVMVMDESIQTNPLPSDPSIVAPMPPPTLDDFNRGSGQEEEKEEIQGGLQEGTRTRSLKTKKTRRVHDEVPNGGESHGASNSIKLPITIAANTPPSSSSNSNNSTLFCGLQLRHAVMLQIFILIVLINLLGVGIFILVELHKANSESTTTSSSSSNGDGFVLDWAPTQSPDTLSELPSELPSVNPSAGTNANDDDDVIVVGDEDTNDTALDCQLPSFQSIANQPGARLLSGLQSCSLGTLVCEAIVNLPFEFPNYNSIYSSGGSTIPPPRTTIYVTPSGMIRFYKYGYFNEVCASDCAEISIAKRPSGNEFYDGDIWVLDSINTNGTKSVTVSWENITFDLDCCSNNLYNAQLTLYENGNVQMCWGSGSINERMQASIWDYSLDNDIQFPVVGDPFQNNGQTLEWPSNQCRIFNFERREWMFPEQLKAQLGCPSLEYSCNSPQVIEMPYDEPASTLQKGVYPTFGTVDPAWQCSKFVGGSNTTRTKWYTFGGKDNKCVCVELRSSNAPFILGVYRHASDQEAACDDDLTCVMETDFTSESIVWRSRPGQTYKLAVSLLPPSSTESFGTYQLIVLESEEYCRDSQGTNEEVYLLPGSCQ